MRLERVDTEEALDYQMKFQGITDFQVRSQGIAGCLSSQSIAAYKIQNTLKDEYVIFTVRTLKKTTLFDQGKGETSQSLTITCLNCSFENTSLGALFDNVKERENTRGKVRLLKTGTLNEEHGFTLTYHNIEECPQEFKRYLPYVAMKKREHESQTKAPGFSIENDFGSRFGVR